MKALLKKGLYMLKKIKKWKSIVWKAPNDFCIPAHTKLLYSLRGFKPNEYVWFNLAHNDYRQYISDYERILSREINGQYKVILDDKLIFTEILRNYARVPEIYAWISEGKIYGLHNYEIDNENVGLFLREVGLSVLKWENGYEGKGVFVIKANKDDSFDVNGRSQSEDEIKKMFRYKEKAILCEYVGQSEFGRSLFPDAVNTIRIVCAKKRGEKEVKIIKAAQRIGNKDSKPVDNVSAGAIVCMVNIETGELGPGIIAKSKRGGDSVPFLENHPDTGKRLVGQVIPGWEQMKKDILDLTNKFPYLNLVAWDVLLIKDGFCIIEGNASAGCVMFQMQTGIRNEEIGDIYRSYGII